MADDSVTRILAAASPGDPAAAEQLLPLVYTELRRVASAKMARERAGQTLQATELVHEAYLRLLGADQKLDFETRGHFFAAAAEAMRRILIDRPRRKRRLKHGGDRQRIDLEQITASIESPRDDVLAVDEALGELEKLAPQKAALVKLRYYAGLTIPQAAEALGISITTASRHWTYARTWLLCRLNEGAS